jgi:hypothetical protein
MFKQIGLFVLCAYLVVASALAQQAQSQDSQPQVSSTTQTVNAASLKKVVSFLRVSFMKDGKLYDAKGTGFFVFYEDKRLSDHGGFIYLVTNEHVAAPGIEEGKR